MSPPISAGAYALDTVNLLPKLELTAGVRVDRFDATANQSLPVTPDSPFKRVDVMPSWRSALVFKPVAGGSIYFDYGTSFNPSAETLALSVATQNAPPGREPDVRSRHQMGFVRAQAVVAGSGVPHRQDQRQGNGECHHRCLVWQPTGERRPDTGQRIHHQPLGNSGQLRLPGWQESQDRRSSRNRVGAQLANVPRNTFSTWSTFDLPWHLSIGGGADFVDSRTASSTTPLDPVTGLVKQVPGYWVFNAMAKYPLSEHVDLRANVYNLADKYYYDQIHPAHIVPGAARSALLGITFKF